VRIPPVVFATALVALAAPAATAFAQSAQTPAPSPIKWEILDNSFLVEEAFNQERGVFQNIFTWTRGRDRTWDATFTQEWPVPGMTHQLSYTVPLSGTGTASGLGDVMLNYRYQWREGGDGRPAIAPRFSVILPTGRESDGLGAGTAGLQINLPLSQQFGNVFVHANAGFTWQGDDRTPFVSGSGIWRVAPLFNLMLEAVVDGDDAVTVSPGARQGFNISTHQLVVGAAVPITRASGRTTTSLFTYLSYELPFR
jgi:hypothetical protein